MKFLRGVCCLLIILLVLTRCSDDDQPSVDVASGKLIESISAGTQTAATLKLLVTVSGYKIDASLLKHDVEVFKVKYRTKFQGEDITASGLIILPQTDASVSLNHYVGKRRALGAIDGEFRCVAVQRNIRGRFCGGYPRHDRRSPRIGRPREN